MSARKIAVTLGLGLIMSLTTAASAGATIGIDSFETTSTTTRAGDHPDLRTKINLIDSGQLEAPANVIVNLPEGMFGNPNSVLNCTASDFGLQQCPSDSQVGLITVWAIYQGTDTLLGTAPIFSIEPVGGETALFSFTVPKLEIPISIPVAVRTATDYGMRFTVSEISQLTPLTATDVTFWGYPAHPENDDERFPKGSFGLPAGCVGLADASCLTASTVSSLPVAPLSQNPSHCTGESLTATLEVQSYQDPGNASFAESDYPQTTQCERQTFNPVLHADLTAKETDAPSGIDLSMRAPQFIGFSASPSSMRNVTVTFPEGLTINPDAADGQTACPDALANFDEEIPSECPDNSKVGTFEIGSPSLSGPLVGSIFIGEPKPDTQYRIFMVADGFGIHAKLIGIFLPDPATGRLTIVFKDLPQVPFEKFDVHLFASDRGILATPTRCTIFQINSHFTPWNAVLPPQQSNPYVGLESGPGGSPCPGAIRPFEPRLVAGTSNPRAGAFSAFRLKLDRDDGDQFLGDLNFKMPPGFTGYIKGIDYCSESSIATAAGKLGRIERTNPSCPSSSQVGTTNVTAGPGSHPFNAVGKMYLAGPLKGAPLSLVAITPALAGPYDYGNVVVRVGLEVDPLTAQVKAVSDRMPQIIGGIPIRMRSIQVNIDRPNFTVNPTNCSAMSVDSQGIGDQGTVTDFSSYFHAVNCASLPFRPRMTVTQLGKRKDTKRNRNPVLRFELRTRPGDANIKALAVTLPKAFAIDQRHLGNICSRAQLAAERCAGRQRIGSVETTTPLLDEPLKGPAYAVSGYGKLPRLAFILDGQVTMIPQAESASVKGGFLRTVVPVVPDAPIGHFRLDLLGGKEGYLINTRDLCRAPSMVQIDYTAQSGKTLTQRVKTKTPCGKARQSTKRGA